MMYAVVYEHIRIIHLLIDNVKQKKKNIFKCLQEGYSFVIIHL